MTITKADLIEILKHFIFGSQGAQLQQKAGTRELLTEDTGVHIREALREELDDLYVRPVLKPTPGTDYALGVGTPYLVEVQEEGIGPYILFTGWRTTDGSNREVFVADIDEDFKLSNVRKLISVGDPSADFTSHDSIHAVYNPFGGWWWLFTTSRYTPEGPFPNNVACAFRYNKTFTTRLSSHAPLFDTSGALFRVHDSGFAPLRDVVSDIWFAFIRRTPPAVIDGIYGSFCTDLRSVPPLITPSERIYIARTGSYLNRIQPDVLQMIRSRDGIIILAEDLNTLEWTITPYFVHPHNDYTLIDGASFIGIAGRASESLLQPFGSFNALNYGHPHLTWLPNRKLNLFFSMFPSYAPGFKHEIWAMRLPPERLNPRNYRAITYLPWYGDTILANAVTRAFPGYGRKTIYFKSSVAGNLTIEVDPLGDGDWETYETFTNVTRIPPYIMTGEVNSVRLSFSVGATVTAKVILNPNG